jgi:sorbitol-specific phosphotransferase system component IIC
VQQAFINLFGCFFITKLVKEDGEQVVNMWEGILTLLVQLMADTEVNYREGLFDVLQKSV